MSNNNTTLLVLSDKELHEQLVGKMKNQLKDLPEGSLYLKTIRGKECLYHYTNSVVKHIKEKPKKIQKYLSKENSSLKQALQQKEFLKKALLHLTHNIAVQEKFLSEYHPFNPIKIIESLPKAYSDFDLTTNVTSIDLRDNDDANELPPQSKNGTSFYSDGLKHCTPKGMKVRSKSESIIATLLDMNEIPYRYETPLTLGDHTFYPDFTIMRPADQKLFYWEHFGMMNNFEYRERSGEKLQAYIDHGLMPWDRLIATFESNEETFDAQHIAKIIKILLA